MDLMREVCALFSKKRMVSDAYNHQQEEGGWCIVHKDDVELIKITSCETFQVLNKRRKGWFHVTDALWISKREREGVNHTWNELSTINVQHILCISQNKGTW